MSATKIGARQLERLAAVYVRQSTPKQVLGNRESRARQYGLAERAVEMGWSRDRIRTIDSDQVLNSGVFRRQIFRLFRQQEGAVFRIICDV